MAQQPDILIADFEGDDYGDWQATGEAFGPGPARGTLPKQMEVSGFEGRGLVNSYYGQDKTTGTLTSPEFVIERKYLNFLIGGGWHPEKACINLLVKGNVARTASGPNRKPGGTERLDPYSWDVADLAGKTARLEIVDQATGGWGHINIDHVVQSDRRQGVVSTLRDVRIEHDYIVFRLAARQGPRNSASLIVDGQPVRSYGGTSSEEPYWISWDVSRLKGKSGQLKIEELPSADGALTIHESLAQSDEPKGTLFVVDKLYEETYRPQFHFSPKKNWTNDPNGLVYYDGEYHMFFQHNPSGINWGNMTWGHAISTDLVHWTQLDHAIEPDALGTIFSGSAVVDNANTAGWQTGTEKVLVAIYTSAGSHATPPVPFTQSVAYSNDRGRTWTKYEKNPVLGHIVGANRDPKVVWHEPTKKWIMALFLDKNDFALFGSPNLKEWTRLCDVPLPDTGECPDFFELPVDGDPNNTTWVFWGANGNYLLGSFDGQEFKPESAVLRSEWGANCYAAQTWSDIPPSDGRRLQIAWMAGGQYPGMPFNQQMSFPRVLSLRTTPEGARLYREPVKEIELIHQKEHAWNNQALEPGENPLASLAGELFHVRAEIELGSATAFGFDVRGHKIEYSVAEKSISCLGRNAPLEPESGRIQLEILVDRTSLEVFGGDGRVSTSSCFLPDPANQRIGIYVTGGSARVVSLRVFELCSAWRR
ncbi:MAG: glycoside hydrolase family 32 protein [Planctomycetota bacterium]